MTFDEWFHKEYEPADLQIKQYAERNEGLHIPAMVYLEDLQKAFEAGLHADVHTDNSKVIADLEEKLANADYQLEGRDLEIKELKAQIEKMKRCSTCKYSTDLGYCKIRCNGGECNKMDKWEIKEK